MAITNEELLRKRQLALFTDRTAETHLLEEAMLPSSSIRLIHLRGIAGIGKSTLLTAWEDLCGSLGVPHARVNLGGQRTPESIVTAAFNQLATSAGSGEYADAFRNGYVAAELRRLHGMRARVRESPNVSEASMAVVLGSYSEFLRKDLHLTAERVLSELSAVIGRAEAENLLNPTEALTTALLADIEGICRSDLRTCVFLDQYEQVTPAVDAWIMKQFFPRLGSALIVTSGRAALPMTWREWISLIATVEVEPLSPDNTAELVRRGKISNAAVIAQIVRISAGLPLAAGLAIDVVREAKGELEGLSFSELGLVHQLVRLFLADIPEELVTWVQRAAVVRWFNEDMLHQMAEPEDSLSADVAYAQLMNLSFIQLSRSGISIHDSVREFLNHDLRIRSPNAYKDLNQRAYDSYALLLSADLSAEQRREFELERIYHLMRADRSRALGEIQAIIESATLLSQLEISESIIGLTKEIEWAHEQARWLTYLDGIIRQQRNTDNRGSVELLLSILNDPQLSDTKLRLRAAAFTAMTLWYLGRNAEALKWADESVRLAADNAEALTFLHIAVEARGLTYDTSGRYLEAQQAQMELLESARESGDKIAEGWAQNNIGYALWHLGDWTSAISYLQESEDTFEALGHPYGSAFARCHKGLIWVRCGNLLEAGEILSRTLTTCREMGNQEIEAKSLQNLVDYFIAVGDLGRARQAAEQGLKLANRLEHPFYRCDTLRRRALARSAGGDYLGALEDFRLAGEVARGMGARFKELSCRLGQVTMLSRVGDESATEALGELRVATAACPPGYEELRSRILAQHAETELRAGHQAVAAGFFADAMTKAVEFNAVALEDCCLRLKSACAEGGDQEVIMAALERWEEMMAAPSAVAMMRRASERSGALRSSKTPADLLRES